MWALTLAIALGLGGCATIVAGKRQVWQFETEPTGARVLVDGREVGRTPVAVSLRRDRQHRVRLYYNGYQHREIRLQRRINGWFWINLFWGVGYGAVMMIIDAAVGSMWELMPDAGSWSGGMMLHEGGDRMYLRLRLAKQCRQPIAPPSSAPPPASPDAPPPPPAAPPPPPAAPPITGQRTCPGVARTRHVSRGFTPVTVSGRKAPGGHHAAKSR